MHKDTAVIQNTIYMTKDYDQFKRVRGNRPAAPHGAHVRELEAKIKKYGNLTPQKPLQMRKNEEGELEIVDGQHRLMALKNLNMPVYYEIKDGMTLETIRNLNSGNSNWGWLDFAFSYADAESEHTDPTQPKPYTQFIEIANEYRYPFRTLLYYCGVDDYNSASRAEFQSRQKGHEKSSGSFRNGNLVIEDFALAKRLLGQYDDLRKLSKNRTSAFARACYRFIRRSKYDHIKMRSRILEFGEPLNHCYSVTDYMFALEDIYNTPSSDKLKEIDI
jgi:hypothetical protein